MIKLQNLRRAFIFLLLSAGISGQAADTEFSPRVKGHEGTNEVTVMRDLRYGNIPGGVEKNSPSDRLLDLYLPPVQSKKLPVFIFIHGGGFSGGDKGSIEELCKKISAHGFAVVSINYYLTLKHEKAEGASCSSNMARGIPENGFHPLLRKAIENASADTQKAMKWIKKHASRYGFDLSSVAISGGSAGAMTALYTAYVSGQKILPVGAVVNLWGGLENAELIGKDAPPLLTYHGDQDKLIHIDYAHALHRRFQELKKEGPELHILEGKGHAMYKLITAEKTEEIVSFLKKSF